jgi:molecular chaperone DnaK (HSP70)
MSMNHTLTMDEVYLRAGRVEQVFQLAGVLKIDRPFDALDPFGALIYWPRAWKWLRITAKMISASSVVPFAQDLTGLEEVMRKHQTSRERLAPPAFLEEYAFTASSLPKAHQIEFNVEIDTDSAGFLEIAKKHLESEQTSSLVIPLSILFFDDTKHQNFSQPGKMNIACKPCKQLPQFRGAMAIDLGNTISSVAALSDLDQVYRTDAVQMIEIDVSREASLVSAVRFDEIRTPSNYHRPGTRRVPSLLSDDDATNFRVACGRAVLASQNMPVEGVVVGVKQLLSVPEGNQFPNNGFFPRNVPHRIGDSGVPNTEQVEISNHFPGELLFADIFQKFRMTKKAWPGDVVLTYPTTYTRAELKQLTTACVRGWLRSMQQPQNLESEPTPTGDMPLDQLVTQLRQWLHNPSRTAESCPLVRLAIDEATAAGFFHCHRRVFEQPAGLIGFRYLHPHGTRALIIDCGGGTTDIVLIQAQAPSEKAMKLDILARTGLRNFGGDKITHHICRLLKAKLTLQLAKLRDPNTTTGIPAPGTNKESLEKFIEKALSLNSRDREYVPTRFRLRDLSSASFAAQAAFRSMWRLAEDLKRKLPEGKPVKLSSLPKEHSQKETSALIKQLLESQTPTMQQQILLAIGEVSISTAEVDALISDAVSAIIKKCNHLIRDFRDKDTVEVDWVVLSGNGARYPLIQQKLREGIHVAALTEPESNRFTFDEANLKNAVAKGATMARLVARVARAATVEYPSALSERLPFAIGYHRMDKNSTDPIFAEFKKYDELAKNPVSLVLPPGSPGQGQVLSLERCFPGDDWVPFASYKFPDGISDQVRIEYDDELNRIVVKSGEMEGEYTDQVDAMAHVSPQNQGDF